MSIRKDIVKKAGELLNGAGKPVGVPDAVQSRSKAIKRDALPDISFYPRLGATHPKTPTSGEEARPPLNIAPDAIVLRDLTLMVECTAAADEDAGIRMDDAPDPLCEWVVAALCGGDWGGLITNCTHEGSEFAYDKKDGPMCSVTEVFRVWYLTTAGSLTA